MNNTTVGQKTITRRTRPQRGRPGPILAGGLGTLLVVGVFVETLNPPRAGVARHRLYQPGENFSSSEDDLHAIRRVLDHQVAAWNRGDLEGFMKGYWPSNDLTFFSDGTRLRGWQATFRRYRRTYQEEGNDMGRLEFTDLQIERLGPQAAYVTGGFLLATSGGQRAGLFTLVFRRTNEGWRIVHDHTSTTPSRGAG